MSIELVVGIYIVWSVFSMVVYVRGKEEAGFVFVSLCMPLLVAGPLALFLLVDGAWCMGDCSLIGIVLMGTSLLVFFARVSEWVEKEPVKRSDPVPPSQSPLSRPIQSAETRNHTAGECFLAEGMQSDRLAHRSPATDVTGPVLASSEPAISEESPAHP